MALNCVNCFIATSVGKEQKNGSQKLIPRGNGSAVNFLGPNETNIVPIGELSQGTPTKYSTLPKTNSRRIHVKDFNDYLKDMLDDSGYKFSEEYEVRTNILQCLVQLTIFPHCTVL